MNNRLFNPSLIKYEFRNLLGNIFTMIFGVLFPILMTLVFGNVLGAKVPDSEREIFVTALFITSSLIVPLASILVGFSSVFSQELEKNIPLRFKLFGYSEKTLLLSKVLANLIFITLSLGLYVGVVCSVLKIQTPTVNAVLIFLLSIYLLSAVLFMFAYGISLFFKKFGPTFAISMTLYFGIMILSGMFGVQAKDFPDALRFVAYCFPTSYISGDFIDFWHGGSYNFVPFIQSFIFFGAVAGIILFMSILRDGRRVR